MIERDVRIVSSRQGEYSVWVDGCFKGICATREKAEKAAAFKRERPELIEERAVRILKSDPRFKDAFWIGVENTGGGCIAAAIYPAKGAPYVWVTDAADYDPSPTKPFFYGTYLDAEGEQIWLEDLSGEASDEDSPIVSPPRWRRGAEAGTITPTGVGSTVLSRPSPRTRVREPSRAISTGRPRIPRPPQRGVRRSRPEGRACRPRCG